MSDEVDIGQAFKEASESVEDPVSGAEDADPEFERLVERVSERVTEALLNRVTILITKMVDHRFSLASAFKDFYDANPSFRKHQKRIVEILNEVQSEEPQLKVSDVLAEVARRAKSEGLGSSNG